MTAQLVDHALSGIYSVTLVAWSVVIVWGRGWAWRAIRGRAERGDWVAAAMVLLGVAIVSAMLLYLTGTMTTHRRATVLVAVATSPVMIIVSYSRTAAEGHKRAVVISQLVVLALAFVAGAIA